MALSFVFGDIHACQLVLLHVRKIFRCLMAGPDFRLGKASTRRVTGLTHLHVRQLHLLEISHLGSDPQRQAWVQ
jgi:hypothetical protein